MHKTRPSAATSVAAVQLQASLTRPCCPPGKHIYMLVYMCMDGALGNLLELIRSMSKDSSSCALEDVKLCYDSSQQISTMLVMIRATTAVVQWLCPARQSTNCSFCQGGTRQAARGLKVNSGSRAP